MLHPLPPETIYEAKRKSRRAACLLGVVTVFIYFLSFSIAWYIFAVLLIPVRLLWLRLTVQPGETVALETIFGPDFATQIVISLVFAAITAAVHLLLARRKTLDTILAEMGADATDADDAYHHRFRNIVHEAEAATGIYPIRAVLLPSAGCNSFAIQDGNGRAAIGVTEGFLARLSRSELTAVVAHEAAHLAHGDSRLTTIACSLSAVFDHLQRFLAGRVSESTGTRTQLHDRLENIRFTLAPIGFLMWCVVFCGYTFTHILAVAISRQKEILADSHGVEMCREPLALAEALYCASGRGSGRAGTSRRFTAAFIVNPEFTRLDEHAGFFARLLSTHPPVHARLERLARWARSDLRSLGKNADRPKVEPRLPEKPEPQFRVRGEDGWSDPLPLAELLVLPELSALTWISRVGSSELLRAGQAPELLSFFNDKPPADARNWCPRCELALHRNTYEGAPIDGCPNCHGALLQANVLERIVTRQTRTFTREEIDSAKAWRLVQAGSPYAACDFPNMACPRCGGGTSKAFHSYATRVVIDRCTSSACGAVWVDGGELETVQILVEAQAATV